ncbi:MAG: glutamyl-tRNA reductase [Moraxella sp.]|nr:glutamyl-tRNA reductase [Moraxella sp.]
MKLIVIGVNHKTAPVALRERLAFGADLPMALDELKPISDGAVIVSTCNRSEIYAGVSIGDNDDGVSEQAHAICAWLARFKGIHLDEIMPYLYIYEAERALNHWLRVAAGLDSMILGEPQILGQIRQAVAVSQTAQALGADFGWLTQQVFAAARAVRRDTSLGKQAVSLGFATAKLVTQIFDNPAHTTLLIVAAGEMNRLVAHNVAALGMQKIIICNRSPERAKVLADELQEQAATKGRTVQIELVGLDSLPQVLAQADVVSSCSGSMQALIDVSMAKQALKVRRYRPMLLVDLAVPRDIEPNVAKLDNIYLYSIDDLQHVIAGNIESRKQAAVEAELMVSQLASHIESQMQVRAAGEYIHDYRRLMHHKKDMLLTKSLAKLEQGGNPKIILEELAQQLTNTLIHPSSRLLRHSARLHDDTIMDTIAHELTGSYRKRPHD